MLLLLLLLLEASSRATSLFSFETVGLEIKVRVEEGLEILLVLPAFCNGDDAIDDAALLGESGRSTANA